MPSTPATSIRCGVTDTVPETIEASLQLAESALVGLGVPMGLVIASIHERRETVRHETAGGRRQHVVAHRADPPGAARRERTKTMRKRLKVISWNLLRLTGAAVEDVAALVGREKPDLMLMQEATQHIEALPSLVGGHFHRLSVARPHPWPRGVEPAPLRPAARALAAGLAAARPPAAPARAARPGGRHHLRQRPSLARPAA